MTREPGPLQLASVDELWQELSSRYECASFCGSREAKGKPHLEERDLRWHGSFSHAIGLADIMHRRLISLMNSRSDELGDAHEGT